MKTENTSSSTSRVWFITGASSGIGQHLALAALKRQDRVVAASRTLEGTQNLKAQFPDQVLSVAFDVQNEQQVQQAVQQALQTFGRLDVVANNAGYGLFGGVEEATDQQARKVFDTNFFGALNVLRAVLPVLRQQKSGHILQGSSVYGRVSHAGVGLLAATKHALEGVSDALAAEVQPLGIRVTLIEPGMTSTPFLANLDVAAVILDYNPTVRTVQQGIGQLPPEAFLDPARVAEQVLSILDLPEPPLRLLIGDPAVQQVRASLEHQRAELDRWASVSSGANVSSGTGQPAVLV